MKTKILWKPKNKGTILSDYINFLKKKKLILVIMKNFGHGV